MRLCAASHLEIKEHKQEEGKKKRLIADYLAGGDVKYLGLSGMNKIPIPKIIGQMMPIPTTMRHDPDPGAERAAMETQSKWSVC